MLTAAARALHREEPTPWVLDDPLALQLADEEGAEIAARIRTELTPESLLGFTRWCCVRARVVEDVVADELTNGLDQFVILGAGLDTFAYRSGDLGGALRVFEVDHPDTQRWKRRRLDELGLHPSTDVVYVPVDFERQTLRDGLQEAGFEFGRPAVFSWIGVTMYLTMSAIRATLSTILQAAPGSRVVLTYNQPREALAGLGAQTEGVLARIVTEMGEPMVSLFRPAEIEDLLLDLGYTAIEHFGPDEAAAKYFPDRSDVRFGGAQRIVAATVSEARPPRSSSSTTSV